MESGPENYHLKWDSHTSYLNSSVASLINDDKFADVILLPSYSEDGKGIPAHKVILSSCSQFFASIFEVYPSCSKIFLVLPPQLQRKSIEILVQYMYKGETTVPVAILNEVLRGGELLKIRGLCRTNNNSYAKRTVSEMPATEISRSVLLKDSGNSNTEKRIRNISSNASDYSVRHNIFERSPVLLKRTQKNNLNNLCNVEKYPTTSKNVLTENSLENNRNDSHIRGCSELKKKSKTNDGSMDQKRGKLSIANCSNDTKLFATRYYNLRKSVEKRRRSFPDEYFNIMSEKPETSSKRFSTSEEKYVDIESSSDAVELLKVKEEPIDWEDGINAYNLEKSVSLDTIKSEKSTMEYTNSKDTKDHEQTLFYSPLTCEKCHKVFTYPGDWVRHTESHHDTSIKFHSSRNKTNSGELPKSSSLKCDMCSIHFKSPEKWILHVQNSHSGTEQSILNNRKSEQTA